MAQQYTFILTLRHLNVICAWPSLLRDKCSKDGEWQNLQVAGLARACLTNRSVGLIELIRRSPCRLCTRLDFDVPAVLLRTPLLFIALKFLPVSTLCRLNILSLALSQPVGRHVRILPRILGDYGGATVTRTRGVINAITHLRINSTV